jgi:hypothetical protein
MTSRNVDSPKSKKAKGIISAGAGEAGDTAADKRSNNLPAEQGQCNTFVDHKEASQRVPTLAAARRVA